MRNKLRRWSPRWRRREWERAWRLHPAGTAYSQADTEELPRLDVEAPRRAGA